MQRGHGFPRRWGRFLSAAARWTNELGENGVDPIGLVIEVVQQKELRGPRDIASRILDGELQFVEMTNQCIDPVDAIVGQKCLFCRGGDAVEMMLQGIVKTAGRLFSVAGSSGPYTGGSSGL